MNQDTSFLTLPSDECLEVPYHHANGLPMLFPATKGVPQAHLLEWDSLDSSAIHLNVSDERNQNLSAAQQEYLHIHRFYCHANGQWVQELMRPRKIEEEGKIISLPPVIKTKHKSSRSCKICHCAGCLFGKWAAAPLILQKKSTSLKCLSVRVRSILGLVYSWTSMSPPSLAVAGKPVVVNTMTIGTKVAPSSMILGLPKYMPTIKSPSTPLRL